MEPVGQIFCDNLKSAGEIVLREGSPMDAFDRAEGFRYLSRLTRVALESYIEAADPRAPRVSSTFTRDGENRCR